MKSFMKDGTIREDALQIAVANYIKLKYPNLLWTASSNASIKLNYKTANRLKAMGYVPGSPDIVIYEARWIGGTSLHGLHLELKSAKGEQSQAQREWARKAIEKGYGYYIARSFEEAQQIIDDYMRG